MRALSVVVTLLVVACGPGGRSSDSSDNDDDTDDDVIDAPTGACTQGEHRCDIGGYEVCNNGIWNVQEMCALACDPDLGCVDCVPGVATCDGGDVHACNADGTVGTVTMACTGSTVCEQGACADACDAAAMAKSYVGCEYWAADLDNAVEVIGIQGNSTCNRPGIKNVTMQVCANADNTAERGLCDPPGDTCPVGFTCKQAPVCILDAQRSPFAIVVSNPQARAVDVTVSNKAGMSFTQSVAAGAVAALFPQAAPNSMPDQSVDGTGTVSAAYKVVASLSIVAYQFNPLENVNVFSNDGSLLIPRTALDVDYYGMSYETLERRSQGGDHDYNGYLTVVAWQDGTVIEVTPKSNVRASATQPALAAGAPTTFTLNAFDVLTLQAAPGGDLTGSRIRSTTGTQTFSVFGGHEATAFGKDMPPNQTNINGPCCADHLEDQMFPTSTWGKEFAIARSQTRGTGERDVIRIVAQKANTTLQFDPAPVEGTCGTLAPGGVCEVKIGIDTKIIASEPILVGHYLESAIWQDPFLGGVVGEGDPSMAIAVPVEQFRTSYTILIPAQYEKNFMSIATVGATSNVMVDGLNIALTSFGTNAYRAARHQVTPGQHVITCPATCGVTVYGYSDAVSYMFAGGLDLRQIVVN